VSMLLVFDRISTARVCGLPNDSDAGFESDVVISGLHSQGENNHQDGQKLYNSLCDSRFQRGGLRYLPDIDVDITILLLSSKRFCKLCCA
jgi:hypothetical protein